MRRIVKITIAIFIVLVLIGCQPTPQQQFVVNKSESELNELIANPQESTMEPAAQPIKTENVAEPTEEQINTEHVTIEDSNVVDNTTINIYVDAEVELDYEQYHPIVEVVPAGFDMDDANKIFPYFIKGDYYENLMKKDDYSWMITTLEKKVAENEVEEKHIPGIESYKEYLLDLYEMAPDNYKAGRIEFESNNLGNYINLIGKNEYGLMGEAYISNQELQNTIAYYIRSDLSTKYIQSIEYSDTPARGMIMSYDNAKCQAQEFIDYIASKEMNLEYSAYANEFDPYMTWVNEEDFIASETSNQCYVFYFTPQYNSINTLYAKAAETFDSDSSQQAYREPWYSEYIEVMIDDNGIVEFWWVGKSNTVCVLHENVDIINYEQALSLFLSNVYYSSTWASPVFDSIDINIDAIELRMVHVAVKDQIDKYVAIPAWVFIGDKTVVCRGGTRVIEDLVGRKCFMAINAIDGSIIDLDLGY